jgi:N-methylhydantoinase A
MRVRRERPLAMIETAIDIGGTFTDIVCLHDQQRLFLAKVPTTPHDLVQGVRQGVARVLELAGQSAAAVERFIHSTTIATNAILEQKGAITGVLMTAGFEDVLEIGRQKRSKDMGGTSCDVAVEQPDTTTVVYPGFTCRVDAAGNLLLTPLTR